MYEGKYLSHYRPQLEKLTKSYTKCGTETVRAGPSAVSARQACSVGVQWHLGAAALPGNPLGEDDKLCLLQAL